MTVHSAVIEPAPLAASTCEVSVATHYWQGYRYFSRRLRCASPQLAPIVLIGGAFQRKEEWGRLEAELVRVADVLSVDLPGWGAADDLPVGCSVDLLAEALAHLIGDLDIEAVNVFGGSYGSAIAYRFARLNPTLAKRIVLLGTAGSIPSSLREVSQKSLTMLESGPRSEFAEAAVTSLMASPPGATIVRGRAVQRLLQRQFLNLSPADVAKYRANTERLLSEQLIDTTQPPAHPTLVVVGEHDRLTPPEGAREVAQACTQGQLRVIAEANHLLHLQRTGELAELMMRFYQGHDTSGLPFLR
ncbi:alpha/beta fold hydrolase [Natronoglycomyces albus]|uniref:Alpha/beta hydrolase n=1 Tax=Natronoglycomyces albus TaxID=2811108 RepID=A0A895XN07_9ACTN|nr:alpha/beta hydrolase [Natronoglycomyces albus]QSB04425.1 alpha/beta hydrolase [Natronoglycomyces albus]